MEACRCATSTSVVDGNLVVNATPRPLYPRERDPVPTVQQVGAGMDRYGKSRPPHGGSKRGPPNPLSSRYTAYAIPMPIIDVTSTVGLTYDVIEGTE